MPDHICVMDACAACAKQRLEAKVAASRYRALDEALAIVEEKWEPKYDNAGCCVVCGKWSYRDFDNHADDCAAVKEYHERQDKAARIKKLLAPRDVAREMRKIMVAQERQEHDENCDGCCPDCGEHCPDEGGTSCGASR